MQPDPKLQNPFNLQNYNRYGYCYNNPTNCTDPTGQAFGVDDFLLAVEIVWGAHEANIINTPIVRSLTAIAVAAYLGPEGGAWDQGAKYGVEKAAVAGFASGAVATGTFKGAVQGAAWRSISLMKTMIDNNIFFTWRRNDASGKIP